MPESRRSPLAARGQTRPLLQRDCVVVYRWFDVNVYRKSTDDVTATA
jgi:hypothetical protein